jgi:sugar phosphate permease
MQAAGYNHLNGVRRMLWWRWLFIIDGCIGLPLTLLTFVVLPDLPQSGIPRWMKEDEHDLSVRRMQDEGAEKSEILS